MDTKRDYNNGYRSTTYNNRHRTWGWHCPCTDTDALESDNGLSDNTTFREYSNHTGKRRCYAVMEIKRYPQEKLNSYYGRLQREVLEDSTKPSCPLYGVEWTTIPDAAGSADQWFFRVVAWNEAGREVLNGDVQVLNERWYVTFLYFLRGLPAPADVIAKLPKKSCPSGLFS